MTTTDSTHLAFAGAAEQARQLAAHAITAPQLVELYLERIARHDPEINSYRAVLTDTARAEAAAAQRQLDEGKRRPLLGVPVAIKDCLEIASEVTTFGTSAHGPAAAHDHGIVARLRAAGAVIIGQTTCPELNMWPFTDSLSFGTTRNPWDTTRTPGGSSGGSAAAVAAGLAPLAVGTDAAGSVRIPSTWCGLYGFKPQNGRTPYSQDDWYGLSVIGPLTRTVEDAALFLDATATTPPPDGGFAAAAKHEPGRLRIALSTKVPPPLLPRVHPYQRAAVREAGEVLRRCGHHVVSRDPDYPVTAIVNNLMPRFLRGVHDHLGQLPRPENAEKRTRGIACIGALYSDNYMDAVRTRQEAISARILSIFDDVDILITPGTSAGPSRVGEYRRRGAITTVATASTRIPFTAMFNITGQPAAVIPWGLDDDGLPMSIQLVSRPFDEATLLAVSSQIEAIRPWAHRRPPRR